MNNYVGETIFRIFR